MLLASTYRHRVTAVWPERLHCPGMQGRATKGTLAANSAKLWLRPCLNNKTCTWLGMILLSILMHLVSLQPMPYKILHGGWTIIIAVIKRPCLGRCLPADCTCLLPLPATIARQSTGKAPNCYGIGNCHVQQDTLWHVIAHITMYSHRIYSC